MPKNILPEGDDLRWKKAVDEDLAELRKLLEEILRRLNNG